MDAHTALTALKERLAEVADISKAAGVLGWDQRVSMPPRGGEQRAESLATLGPIEDEQPYDSDDASLVRVTRRDWEKERRVPTDLAAEMTREAARGHQVWVQ